MCRRHSDENEKQDVCHVDFAQIGSRPKVLVHRGVARGGPGGGGGAEPPSPWNFEDTMGGQITPSHYCQPPQLCVQMGFTWTFPRNQDATVKSKSELIIIKS